MDWASDRLNEGKTILDKLLSSSPIPFDETIRSRLPAQHGIYAITVKGASHGDTLRAGRTKTASEGLRQRIYQNHLMGRQNGNLRAQLVRDSICANMEEAKHWIRKNCVVQFVVVQDAEARRWAEHFVLSVLRPRYSD